MKKEESTQLNNQSEAESMLIEEHNHDWTNPYITLEQNQGWQKDRTFTNSERESMKID